MVTAGEENIKLCIFYISANLLYRFDIILPENSSEIMLYENYTRIMKYSMYYVKMFYIILSIRAVFRTRTI